MDRKECTKCGGLGYREWKGFVAKDGTEYPTEVKPCPFCRGEGLFDPIDEAEIRRAIINRSSDRIRASKPTKGGDRAYYVWRLARFHGGKDVTMPITALTLIEGDPFQADLEELAQRVAVEEFGTDMVAARRWGRALGYIN